MAALIDISTLKENPDNPRSVTDAKFQALVQSVRTFPQMLEIRPIIANKGLIVLGGNMRLRACRAAGLKQVPVDIVDLTPDQEREFIIKDNVGYGIWDWEMIQADWPEAAEWGLDMPEWDVKDEYPEQIESSGYDESQWFLNVRCESEMQTQKLYEKLTADGYECKIIT